MTGNDSDWGFVYGAFSIIQQKCRCSLLSDRHMSGHIMGRGKSPHHVIKHMYIFITQQDVQARKSNNANQTVGGQKHASNLLLSLHLGSLQRRG